VNLTHNQKICIQEVFRETLEGALEVIFSNCTMHSGKKIFAGVLHGFYSLSQISTRYRSIVRCCIIALKDDGADESKVIVIYILLRFFFINVNFL
jgi:hypothetical protein